MIHIKNESYECDFWSFELLAIFILLQISIRIWSMFVQLQRYVFSMYVVDM